MSAIINPFVVLRSYKKMTVHSVVTRKEYQIINHFRKLASVRRRQELVKMPQTPPFFAFFYSKKR